MLEFNFDKYNLKEKLEYLELLQEESIFGAERMCIDVFRSFYNWQMEFTEATSTHSECCLMAANQIGKTYVGAAIDAMHLLGDYPEDWKGHRFDFAPNCWALGYSMEKTRDLLQHAIFGDYYDKKFKGALVPESRIISHESAMGTPNAMRSVRVRHASGDESKIQFWSYSQGNHALMGDVVDWVHIDEEPRDQTIRPQVLTRTINGDKKRGGRLIYTFTPENGRTDLVTQFMDDPSPQMFFMQKGWSDAPHISAEKGIQLLGQYPAHQREMRSNGSPMLGHGRIYDISEDLITVPSFKIPGHWAVINGMDFGWDHPQAHIQFAIDRENDIFYLTHVWKARQVSANDAWGAVKSWSDNVLAAWPSDGLQHEKGRQDSKQQKDHYQEAGFRMLFERATWLGGSVSVEQGIFELRDRMLTGRFKVFIGLRDFFDEMRQYHRDENGNIVKKYDDILDACRYGYMMKRYATTKDDVKSPTKIIMPQPLKSFGTGARK